MPLASTEQIHTILKQQKATTQEALQLFDALEPVGLDFMLGRWQGFSLHTDHPMDGVLEAFRWYGKEFIQPDQVHPLLFLDNNNEVFKVAPHPILMDLAKRLSFPKNQMVQSCFNLFNWVVKTEESQARLRVMEYRGKTSATMIYDYLPIQDVFRKVDDHTVLGLMDFKSIPQPFFFGLQRSVH